MIRICYMCLQNCCSVQKLMILNDFFLVKKRKIRIGTKTKSSFPHSAYFMYIHPLCRVLIVLYLRTYFINHVYNRSQMQVILNQIFHISPFISFLIFVDFFFSCLVSTRMWSEKETNNISVVSP